MQHSTDEARLGPNRTGLQTSPILRKQMEENIQAVPADAPDGQALCDARIEYIEEADALGSVPPPTTLTGLLKTTAQVITGDRPEVFIDKLAERLAFERGGTRLYDAFIAKFKVYGSELSGVTLEDVQQLRDEEANHALLIAECIRTLGADPTAQTPSADLVGVEAAGFLQAASDPRTTLTQTLHVMLSAELLDNAGWQTLIALAEAMGQDDMARRFSDALDEEVAHLEHVSAWYNALTIETEDLG